MADLRQGQVYLGEESLTFVKADSLVHLLVVLSKIAPFFAVEPNLKRQTDFMEVRRKTKFHFLTLYYTSAAAFSLTVVADDCLGLCSNCLL